MGSLDNKGTFFSYFNRIATVLTLVLSLFLFLPTDLFSQEYTVQTIGNYGDITVMELEGNYDAGSPDGTANVVPRQEIAKEFYQTHADQYDFLVIFSNFAFQMPEHEVVAFYLGVQNDVEGIGIEPFDYSDLFGSAGKLQGTIDMGDIASVVSDPLDPAFTDTMTVLAHELLHRWAAHVRFREAGGGISTDLLGRGGYHWSFLLDTRGSLLYGNRWQANGDGTFTSLPGWKYYSPLDLYLMGLYEASEVPPMLLIDNPEIDPERLPEEGVTIEGTAQTVTIDDIIDVEGERIPSVGESQKSFKTGFILVTRPNTFTGAEITGIRAIMHNWVTWFSALTDGRAIVAIDAPPLADIPVNPGVTPPPYDPRTSPPEINDAIAWLMDHQGEDGSWTDIPQTSERDTAEAVLALRSFSLADSSVSEGLQWLVGITSGNTDYLARKIEAVSLTGGDSAALVTELLARVNDDGGWGSREHYASNPVDTSFALRALAVANHAAGGVIEGAISYLTAAQHADGGWGAADQSSTIQATANVLAAFNQYNDTYPVADAIQRAIAWLTTTQNPDGGFGTSPSTIYETAVAIMILKQYNVSADITGEAADYILNLQSEDGSWYASPYQTALAVSAVWKVTGDPDLSVSTTDITFTPSSVTSLPTDITIEAQIKNLGLTAVDETTVVLYDGAVDEANKLGEGTIAVPGNGSVPVTFTATVTDGNAHYYYIVVDPQNQVAESSEANNTALKVLYPETSYDFEILAGNVTVTPDLVDYLQTVTITATVANRGTTTAYNVPLRYFINITEGPIDIATHYVDIPAGGVSSM